MSDTPAAMSLVYCPCPSLEEAKRLGHALLDARACRLHQYPARHGLALRLAGRARGGERSRAHRQDEQRRGAARDASFSAREHPYEVPAILTLALADVNAPYRDWLMQGIA